MSIPTFDRQLATTPETAYHDDLREYLRVIRARKWTIVLTTAIVVAASALFTLHQTPIYRATAEVLVQPVQNPLNLYMPPTTPDMNTEQEVATSQAVADEVLKATTIAVPFSQLTENLDVAVVPDTDVLQVSYSSPSPTTWSHGSRTFRRSCARVSRTSPRSRASATCAPAPSRKDCRGWPRPRSSSGTSETTGASETVRLKRCV